MVARKGQKRVISKGVPGSTQSVAKTASAASGLRNLERGDNVAECKYRREEKKGLKNSRGGGYVQSGPGTGENRNQQKKRCALVWVRGGSGSGKRLRCLCEAPQRMGGGTLKKKTWESAIL